MDINYLAVLPEIILSLFGMAIMLAAVVVPARSQRFLGYVALIGILLAIVSATLFFRPAAPTFFGMIFQDGFGLFCRLLFFFSSGSVGLVAINYLDRDKLPHAEFFALLLFATVGMSLMALSADLILTFLGLEILSIATYVLAGFRRHDVKSGESALKYFLLGSLSTAFLLYGIAFIYGATGSLKYSAMAHAVEGADRFVALLLGLGLLVVGFGFKAALVPFHVWTPDVYEGAPIPVTAHLAVSSKAAAFLAFVRILHQVLPGLSDHWQTVLWVSAFLTMLVGNIVALSQTNIKRMLAYSSIAHAGYLLVGLVARNESGVQALLFYLGSYALMTLGAFAVVQLIGGGRRTSGWARRLPRSRAESPLSGRLLDGLPAFARRDSGDRGFHGQAVPVFRCNSIPSLLAGRRRPSRVGDRLVLLSESHRLDVHAGTRSGRVPCPGPCTRWNRHCYNARWDPVSGALSRTFTATGK